MDKNMMNLNLIFLISGASMGILIAGLAIPLILGKIKPNRLYGFRTKKTLSDEKIWYPANKYAGKIMIITGIIISIASLAVYLIFTNINLFIGIPEKTIQIMLNIIWLAIIMLPIIIMIIASLLYLKKL